MKRMLSTAVAAFLGFSGGAQANDIACGETYITKQGETAYHVAAKAFQTGLHRQLFVNAILQRHGKDIAKGTVLSIPCAGESGLELPKDYWTATTYQPAEVSVVIAGYDHAVVSAASDANKMYNALFESLLARGLLIPSYTSLAEQDLATHRPFPTSGDASDVSFPWMRSECSEKSEVRLREGPLCTGALWSDPMFEITSGVYVEERRGVDTSGDLANIKVCIADESRAAALQSEVLAASVDTAARGPAALCLNQLRSGAVSAAIVPDIAAAAEMRDYRLAPKLKKLPGVVFSDMVHAVVDNKNPNARRILKRLNDGLEKIRVSGEWYDIVHAELSQKRLN